MVIEQDLADIWREGYLSRHWGRSLNFNPYFRSQYPWPLELRRKSEAWENGWEIAEKQLNERLDD